MPSKVQTFRAEILDGHKGAAVIVPFDPVTAWGTKPVNVAFRRLGHPVEGTINGHSFEGWIGYRWGRHFMMVDDDLQRGAKAKVGDTVDVVVKPSRASRSGGLLTRRFAPPSPRKRGEKHSRKPSPRAAGRRCPKGG